jgi:hypothetical protein
MKLFTATLLAFSLAASPALAAPWGLTVAKDEALLTYADSSGEDAATSLRCTPHSGKIRVTMFLEHRQADHLMGAEWVDKAGRRAPWKTNLSVASGDVNDSFPAAVNADEMNGGSQLDAAIPTASPVVAAFAKTGAIRLSAYGETVKDPKVPAAKAAGLVKACSK